MKMFTARPVFTATVILVIWISCGYMMFVLFGFAGLVLYLFSCRKLFSNPGRKEFEVWGCGPEATEVSKQWDLCEKNPGHRNFVPVPDFSMKHLPEHLQLRTVYEYIQATCGLTVRLRVNGTSSARPDDGYYYGGDKGSLRIGSGIITAIETNGVDCPCSKCKRNISNVLSNDQDCPCSRCKRNPSNPHKSWSCIIRTAKHVVYDDFEASSTKVDFFFDDKKSRDDGRLKTASGIKIKQHNFNDCGYLICVTHDSDLVDLVDSVLCRWQGFHRTIQLREWPDKPITFFVVSHPHGSFKYVTIGELKSEKFHDEGGVRYSYSTDTCPGSSGALVVGLGRGVPSAGFSGICHCLGGDEEGWNVGYR